MIPQEFLPDDIKDDYKLMDFQTKNDGSMGIRGHDNVRVKEFVDTITRA